MIIDVIVKFVLKLLLDMLNSLPAVAIEIPFQSTISGMLAYADIVIDVRMILAGIGLLIGFFIAIELFYLVVWILQKARILG